MTDKQINHLDDREFDLYLEAFTDSPPPAELFTDFNPWQTAMDRILWGVGMTTLTLNFLNLNVIFPTIGLLLMFLGFRALRRENKWFRLGYFLSWIRILWCIAMLALNSTIYAGESDVRAFLTAGTYALLVPGFLTFVALRNGIRCVQKKVGLPPHGGNGMLIWYLIMIVLGIIHFSGFTVWGLVIVYICILRNLCKLPKELEEAGYAISPAPVKVSDNAVKVIFTCAVALALAIGFTCFNRYPMDWNPVENSTTRAVQEVRKELLDLGFPEHILEDLTEEDILSCKGALRIVVEVNDYPVNEGRQVTELAGDNVLHSFTVYDDKELRLTGIALELPGDRESWKIIHHFQWVMDAPFCGTEVIHLWPAYQRVDGWNQTGELSGQVLYSDENRSYAAPYHSLEEKTYTQNSIFWGEQTSTDVFAAFSMSDNGTNQRGYISYTVEEVQDGWIINAWINYTHQSTWLQYPVMTALDKHLNLGVSDTRVFKTVQDALQFFPSAETVEVFGSE